VGQVRHRSVRVTTGRLTRELLGGSFFGTFTCTRACQDGLGLHSRPRPWVVAAGSMWATSNRHDEEKDDSGEARMPCAAGARVTSAQGAAVREQDSTKVAWPPNRGPCAVHAVSEDGR